MPVVVLVEVLVLILVLVLVVTSASTSASTISTSIAGVGLRSEPDLRDASFHSISSSIRWVLVS